MNSEEKLTLVRYSEKDFGSILSIPNVVSQKEIKGEGSLLKQVEELMKYSNGRILLADDEPFCLESMKLLLEKAGFDVEHKLDVCISGEEMLSLVTHSFQNDIHFRLIFTDYSMPGMNGVEATEHIR